MTHNGVQTLQRRPFIFICSYKPWVFLVAKTLGVDVTGNAVRACRCSSSSLVVVVVSFFSPQRVARWPFDTFHTHGKIVERRAMKRTDHHDPDPTSKVGRNSPSPLGHPGAPTKSKTAQAQGLDGSTTARDISKVALSTASSDDHHDPDPTTKKGRIRPRPSHPRSQNRLRNTGLTWCAMTGSRGLMFIAASLK